MRTMFGAEDEERPGTGQPALPRNRTLRGRNFAKEQLPAQLLAARGSTDPQVFEIAAEIYLAVIDPRSTTPWHGASVDSLASTAFAGAIARCQQEAVELSAAEEARSQLRVRDADKAVDAAEDMIHEANRISDDPVEDASGTQCPAREALAAHQADRALAAERESIGDTAHLKKPLLNAWIIIGAIVFAFLDMLLLWRPLLGLGPLDTSGMLLKWVVAGCFIAAQALFIAMTLRYYRDRERESRDRRDAVQDHDRAAHRAVDQGDPSAPARQAPDINAITQADRKLITAQDWLVTAATVLGVIGAVRVALLARGNGQSVVEATLFGAIIGLILGGLVLLLGWVSCRGNRLGDRIRAGAEVVAGIHAREEQQHREVEAAREAARQALHDTDQARNDAAETREWVVNTYWQALLLASRWIAQPAPPAEQLVVRRSLPTADDVTRRADAVTSRLTEVDSWLAGQPTTTAQPSAAVAESVPAGHPGRLRPVAPPDPGQPGDVIGFDSNLPGAPQPPRWLILIGAGIAILAAFAAAVVAPEWADESVSVQAAVWETRQLPPLGMSGWPRR
ncbi:MAG: hypothetical protein ACRDUV_13220 [Pseudonocardiaceae bacterium]